MITFGSRWSGGVTSALKSTLKKQLHITNTQYAVLTTTKDFIKTSLILFSGILTDRYGGANTMLCGTAVDTFGAILIAAATQVRSFKFMIVGSAVEALGEVAISVAQYKILSSCTELAEQRFNILPAKAGLYSAISHYSGFFLALLVGIFVDLLRQRITLMLVCSLGLLLSMCLVAWGPTVSGAAASLIIFGIASSYDSTLITDSLRTSMWYQDIFGLGIAIKAAIKDSMDVIISLIAGVLQDRDENKYYKVIILYVTLTAGSVIVASIMLALGFATDNIGKLQWSRKKRVKNGHIINAKRQESESEGYIEKHIILNIINFSAVILLILGAWVAYL
ncbi:hypothetical protein IL306_012051 [Fusarium sp. DS 682]|nr:hypothetical protein IL306_012051 [Fusarium sp. DS 682]